MEKRQRREKRRSDWGRKMRGWGERWKCKKERAAHSFFYFVLPVGTNEERGKREKDKERGKKICFFSFRTFSSIHILVISHAHHEKWKENMGERRRKKEERNKRKKRQRMKSEWFMQYKMRCEKRMIQLFDLIFISLSLLLSLFFFLFLASSLQKFDFQTVHKLWKWMFLILEFLPLFMSVFRLNESEFISFHCTQWCHTIFCFLDTSVWYIECVWYILSKSNVWEIFLLNLKIIQSVNDFHSNFFQLRWQCNVTFFLDTLDTSLILVRTVDTSLILLILSWYSWYLLDTLEWNQEKKGLKISHSVRFCLWFFHSIFCFQTFFHHLFPLQIHPHSFEWFPFKNSYFIVFVLTLQFLFFSENSFIRIFDSVIWFASWFFIPTFLGWEKVILLEKKSLFFKKLILLD